MPDDIPINERTASGYPHDQEIWSRAEAIASKYERPLRELLESFPIYVRRINLTRFLQHYELYKLIADLPGSIVECGVYRGSSLLTWAKLLEIFHAGDRSRKVIGFDNFRGFERINKKDGEPQPNRAKVVAGWNPSAYYEELLEHVQLFADDSFVPHANRIELVEGDIAVTAPQYVHDKPGLRISLLHLDVDMYEPTLEALRFFYPLVVRGGVVILDEYAATDWAGESRAVEEYFEGRVPRFVKSPFSSSPGAYFLKKD